MHRCPIAQRYDIHALHRYEAGDEEVALHAISARTSLPNSYMTTSSPTTTTTTISEGTWTHNTCASSPTVLGAYQQSLLYVWPSEQSKIHHPQPIHWSSHGGTENQGAQGDFSLQYVSNGSVVGPNIQYQPCTDVDYSDKYNDAMLAQQYPHVDSPVSPIYNKFLGNGFGQDCTANGGWPSSY